MVVCILNGLEQCQDKDIFNQKRKITFMIQLLKSLSPSVVSLVQVEV